MTRILGFRARTQQIIENSLFRKIKSKQPIWTKIADENSRKAFYSPLFSKPPVDTGQTRKATFAKMYINNDFILFRFATPNNVPRGWRVFPLLGKSTSAKYRERNWLKQGALATKQKIINNK